MLPCPKPRVSLLAIYPFQWGIHYCFTNNPKCIERYKMAWLLFLISLTFSLYHHLSAKNHTNKSTSILLKSLQMENMILNWMEMNTLGGGPLYVITEHVRTSFFFSPTLCSLIVELRDKRYGCLKHTVQNDKYWQNQEIKTIIKTIKPTEPPQLFLGKDWKNIPFLSIHYWPQTKTLGWRDLWCTWSKATPIQAAVLSQLRLGLVSLQRKANLWQQRRTTEVQKFLLQIKGFLHAAVKVMERPYKLDSMRKIPSTMCLSPTSASGFLKLISIVISFSTWHCFAPSSMNTSPVWRNSC